MGPSGCGKSTFISSLAGTLPKGKLTGKIQYTRHQGQRSFAEEYTRVRWAGAAGCGVWGVLVGCGVAWRVLLRLAG
jgi:ABC-type glutathione transport system ATPase component